MNNRKLVFMMTLLSLFLFVTGCGQKNEAGKTSNSQGGAATTAPTANNKTDTAATNYDSPDNPVVTIEMDNGKLIKIQLYPKVAPNTVNNFISLVKKASITVPSTTVSSQAS